MKKVYLLLTCLLLFKLVFAQKPISFNEPFRSLPENALYFNESLTDLGKGSLNNHDSIKLKSLVLTGKNLVFRKGEENKFFEKYNNRNDIKVLKIYADSLTIESAINLPECNVEIYCRRLEFKGKDSYINTQPLSLSTNPGQFKDGANGLNGGNLKIFVKEFVSIDKVKRFQINGGDGQQAGLGHQGIKGKSMSPISSRAVLDGKRLPDKCGYRAEKSEIVLATVYNHQVFLNAPDCYDGKKAFPANGEDSKAGGHPGEGGTGGEFVSNLNLNLNEYISNCGGTSGSKAPDYDRGGSPGEPNPAYHMDVKINGNKGGIEHIVISNIQVYGKGAKSPLPKKREGDQGRIVLDKSDSLAWMTPLNIDKIIQYDNDLYYIRYYKASLYICNDYIKLIDEKLKDSSFKKSHKGDFEQLQQLYSKFLRNKINLDNDLDFYGNPVGWAPYLSFEVYKTEFEKEIKSSINVLYLTYWFGNSMDSSRQKARFLNTALSDEKIELQKSKEDFNNIIINQIPKFQVLQDSIKHECDSLISALENRESLLKYNAEQTVKVQNANAQSRSALRIFGTIISLIPVGQPFTGIIGVSMRELNQDSGSNWDHLKQIIKEYPDSKAYAESINKFNSSIDKIDFSSSDKLKQSLNKNKDDIENEATHIGEHISNNIDRANSKTVALSDVDQELKLLENQDPNYISIIDKIEKINNLKITTNRQINRIENRLSDDVTDIVNHNNNIIVFYNNLMRSEAGYDDKVEASIENMKIYALKRLRFYHYQFAKAYEYLALKPYKEDLLLDSLYSKFYRIAKANNVELSKDQIESLLESYEEELSDITKQIFNEYELRGGRDSISRVITLDSNEIAILNNSKYLKINFANKLTTHNELDRRIKGVYIKNISSNTKNGSADIVIKNSGISKFFDGKNTYLFQHLGYNGSNNLQWKFAWDISDSKIYSSNKSDENESLIYTLLNKDYSKIIFFSRPGLAGDEYIYFTPSDSRIKIMSLKLRVTYTYYNSP